MATEMYIYNSTIKIEVRALTQKRSTEKTLIFKPLTPKRNIVFVFSYSPFSISEDESLIAIRW